MAWCRAVYTVHRLVNSKSGFGMHLRWRLYYLTAWHLHHRLWILLYRLLHWHWLWKLLHRLLRHRVGLLLYWLHCWLRGWLSKRLRHRLRVRLLRKLAWLRHRWRHHLRLGCLRLRLSTYLNASGMLSKNRTAWLRLLHRWLSHVDFTRVAWVEESEVLLETWATIVSCEDCANVCSTSVVSDLLDVVSKNSVKGLAAALHEPNFKVSVLGQGIEKRLDGAFPIICTENWLLKRFTIQVGIRDIKCSEASTLIIHENKS